MRTLQSIILILALVATAGFAPADDVLLLLPEKPHAGLVVGSVDLTAAARWCGVKSVEPGGLRAFSVPEGRPIPFQFVPAAEFDPAQRPDRHRVAAAARGLPARPAAV